MSGKTLVVKAIILPLLLYFGVIFPLSKRWTQRVMRMLFIFFWGSKMERITREDVMKTEQMGGYNFPNIERFLELQLWMVHYKAFSAGGKTASLMRYLIGWPLLRWGWCEKDLRRPMSLVSPSYYLRMKAFFGA